MRIKTKIVPVSHIGFNNSTGEYCFITTLKEEAVIEESVVKKVFNVLKKGSLIFSIILIISAVSCMCFSDNKVIWFLNGITITSSAISILIDFLKEFKK